MLYRNLRFKNDSFMFGKLINPSSNDNLEQIHNLEILYMHFSYNQYSNHKKFNCKISYKFYDLIDECDYCSINLSLPYDPNFNIENNTISINLLDNMNDNQTSFQYFGKHTGNLKLTLTTKAMNRFINWSQKIFNSNSN